MAQSKPSNKKLYNSIKKSAKKKFKVYPSAYANAWVVRTYKSRGGRYTSQIGRRKRSLSLKKSISKIKKTRKRSRK